MIVETTRGSDFAGLHRYLTEDRDHEVILIRVLTSVATAASEMAAVAGERPRVRKPVLHISISFAPEDTDKVTDALALELFDEIDIELGLGGHQCLVARHDDTRHRHYHRSDNIVHPVTFKTPPDRPNQALVNPSFERRASCKRPPRPLSWDAFILPRLWAVCDRFAKKHGLRRVKTPLESVSSKDEDRLPRVPAGVLRREERTGVKSLLEQHEALRAALGAGTWGVRQKALQPLGIRLEAAEVAIKHGGSRIRGLRLVAIADAKNAIKASSLGAAYGLAALDKSVLAGSAPFAEWWAQEKVRGRTVVAPKVEAVHEAREVYLHEFQRYERRHAAARAAATEARRRLKLEHRKQRARLTREIAIERKAALAGVPKPFVGMARESFQARIAGSRRAQMALHHSGELRELRVPRKKGWATWLRERGGAGDRTACELLAEMETRHRRQGHRSKAAEDRRTAGEGTRADHETAWGNRTADVSAATQQEIALDPTGSHSSATDPPINSSPEAAESAVDPLLQYSHMKGRRGKGDIGR